MLAALIPKLRNRFGVSAQQCGANSSDVAKCDTISTEFLAEILNDSRLEFSTYRPQEDILKVQLHVHNPIVTLGYEPYSVSGVYISNPTGYNYGYNYPPSQFLANYYADPALARVDDIYRDYTTPEATFVRSGRNIRITSLFNEGSVAEIHVTRMRGWNEMPDWAEPIIMKMGIIRMIDRTTTASETVLKIPTAQGYFELDGGRVMQNLRSKLDKEVYGVLQPGTTSMSLG
jgi:hypothetical protein